MRNTFTSKMTTEVVYEPLIKNYGHLKFFKILIFLKDVHNAENKQVVQSRRYTFPFGVQRKPYIFFPKYLGRVELRRHKFARTGNFS